MGRVGRKCYAFELLRSEEPITPSYYQWEINYLLSLFHVVAIHSLTEDLKLSNTEFKSKDSLGSIFRKLKVEPNF